MSEEKKKITKKRKIALVFVACCLLLAVSYAVAYVYMGPIAVDSHKEIREAQEEALKMKF